MIKIYSVPNCEYCDKAKALLNDNNIEFEDINLREKSNRGAREYYRSLDIKTAPVIVDDDADWIITGDNLEELKIMLGIKND